MILVGVAQAGGFDPGTLMERLPYERTDARIHYTGSIDKKGGNASVIVPPMIVGW